MPRKSKEPALVSNNLVGIGSLMRISDNRFIFEDRTQKSDLTDKHQTKIMWLSYNKPKDFKRFTACIIDMRAWIQHTIEFKSKVHNAIRDKQNNWILMSGPSLWRGADTPTTNFNRPIETFRSEFWQFGKSWWPFFWLVGKYVLCFIPLPIFIFLLHHVKMSSPYHTIGYRYNSKIIDQNMKFLVWPKIGGQRGKKLLTIREIGDVRLPHVRHLKSGLQSVRDRVLLVKLIFVPKSSGGGYVRCNTNNDNNVIIQNPPGVPLREGLVSTPIGRV